tara:strand:+ start:1473 stop:2372 length:900 start_codon:yes stop_codon:yes gene_type:complete
MSTDITSILKEAVGDEIAQETLDKIETVFNEAVEERSTIRVEKALIEQDESHAGKLESLLEAIDKDHTGKLEKVVEALDKNHSQKLVQLVKRYENSLNEDASGFKDELVESISNYIEEYIDEQIPVQDIEEAVKNKKASRVLENLRTTLGVDMALAKHTIKDAIQEGKEEIDTSHEKISTLAEANNVLTSQVTQLQSHILLNEKSQDLPQEKREYMYKVLSDKSPEFITENFDYTLRLFDKTEQEKLMKLKEEAVSRRGPEVDVPVVQESVEATSSPEPEEQGISSPFANTYMSELNKF